MHVVVANDPQSTPSFHCCSVYLGCLWSLLKERTWICIRHFGTTHPPLLHNHGYSTCQLWTEPRSQWWKTSALPTKLTWQPNPGYDTQGHWLLWYKWTAIQTELSQMKTNLYVRIMSIRFWKAVGPSPSPRGIQNNSKCQTSCWNVIVEVLFNKNVSVGFYD